MANNSETSFADSSIPRRSAGAVEAEVDGELVLLSPKDFSYFGAQGAGGSVWALIDGTRSVGEILAELEATFAAPDGDIRAETMEFLDALREAGLVEFAP